VCVSAARARSSDGTARDGVVADGAASAVLAAGKSATSRTLSRVSATPAVVSVLSRARDGVAAATLSNVPRPAGAVRHRPARTTAASAQATTRRGMSGCARPDIRAMALQRMYDPRHGNKGAARRFGSWMRRSAALRCDAAALCLLPVRRRSPTLHR
jgi:hypothetical protein